MTENVVIHRADVNTHDDDGRTPVFRFLTTKYLIHHGDAVNHDAFIHLLRGMISDRRPNIVSACDILEFAVQARISPHLSPAVHTLIEM